MAFQVADRAVLTFAGTVQRVPGQATWFQMDVYHWSDHDDGFCLHLRFWYDRRVASRRSDALRVSFIGRRLFEKDRSLTVVQSSMGHLRHPWTSLRLGNPASATSPLPDVLYQHVRCH